MPFHPDIHHRRSIRLKGYDYSQEGMYFITICCQNRICRFGKITGGEMILNEYGDIAYNEWSKLQERYPHVTFDVFQIMPNHVHGIINISVPVGVTAVGATLAVALTAHEETENRATAYRATENRTTAYRATENRTTENRTTAYRATARVALTAATLGNIVGAYKSLVMNKCLGIYKSKNEYMGKFWQRNYYEHIIRDQQSYFAISEYIINNPAKWTGDKFYTE
jgi:REP element-mobilizing transposase RayT